MNLLVKIFCLDKIPLLNEFVFSSETKQVLAFKALQKNYATAKFTGFCMEYFWGS